MKWIANLRTMEGHPPPLLTLAGAVLLAAALRWRREDARVVLGMAAVPQLPMFADQLPLLLVARTRVESMVLALLSHVGGLLWLKTRCAGRSPERERGAVRHRIPVLPGTVPRAATA